MRDQAGGNGETRKFRCAHSFFYPCLTSCDGADFSIQVVSEEFTGKVRFCELLGAWVYIRRSRQTMMQRHRMIYAALSEELKNGLHALSLNTKTDAEVLKAKAHTPQGN